MKRILGSILDIRRGEWTLTLLMFLYNYLILVTYYFLKPARDSLFLVNRGFGELPQVFILTALVVVPVASAYSRLGHRLKLTQLINATTLLLVANLVILRWLLNFEASWVFYVFYVWVSIYGVLSTSQFWLYANAVFDPTQAKRIFVLLTVAAILGAFTGGEVTSMIVQDFGVATEDLLVVCAVLLLLTVGLVNVVWTIRQRDLDAQPPTRIRDQRPETLRRLFETIQRSRHLQFIIAMLTLTMMTGTFVDYQFKTVTVEAFPEKAALTSFFGVFYGRLSLASLVLQSVFAYRFLRVLGVGGVLLFLPAGLLLGSGMMLAVPGLIAGVLLRGADGAFRYSLDKTGRELLFLPVSLEDKKRTKVFIDVFVDRWARGMAGGLLLLCTTVAGMTVRQLSVVTIVLLLVWITVALLSRREYVNAFRKALERREIDPGQLRVPITEAATLRTLIGALGSPNERQVAYALDLLADAPGAVPTDALHPLLGHASPEIRLRAVRALRDTRAAQLMPEVERLVADADADVRQAALDLLQRHATEAPSAWFESWLRHPESRVRAAALACMTGHEDASVRGMVTPALVDDLLQSGGPDAAAVRGRIASAIGMLRDPAFTPHLRALMEDSDLAVQQAALMAAGRTRDREFVPALIGRLADAPVRKAARAALATYGSRVVGTLHDHLVDESVRPAVRQRIPGVLALIPSQEAVDLLARQVDAPLDPGLRYQIVKALNKLHARHAGLRFPEQRIEAALLRESREYYEAALALRAHGKGDGSPAARLLERALHETLGRNLERIFRLLGLRFPPRDMYSAYQGIVSGKKVLRASAVEFLDNILGKSIKRYLLPILDQDAAGLVLEHGERLFGLRTTTVGEALRTLIGGQNPWLKACAIYAVPSAGVPDLVPLVHAALQDGDPVVREAAGLVLKGMEPGIAAP